MQALALYWQVEPRLEGNTLVLGDRLRAPLDQFGDIYIDFPLIDAGSGTCLKVLPGSPR